MRHWTPEFDIKTHRVLYAPHLQCGFCDEPTAEVIATVGVCVRHRTVLREIEAQKDHPRHERRRPIKRRKIPVVVTKACRCGAMFTYTKGHRGHRVWCDPCTKLGATTYDRLRKLARRAKLAAAG